MGNGHIPNLPLRRVTGAIRNPQVIPISAASNNPALISLKETPGLQTAASARVSQPCLSIHRPSDRHPTLFLCSPG